jgi:hypothetical protein
MATRCSLHNQVTSHYAQKKSGSPQEELGQVVPSSEKSRNSSSGTRWIARLLMFFVEISSPKPTIAYWVIVPKSHIGITIVGLMGEFIACRQNPANRLAHRQEIQPKKGTKIGKIRSSYAGAIELGANLAERCSIDRQR